MILRPGEFFIRKIPGCHTLVSIRPEPISSIRGTRGAFFALSRCEVFNKLHTPPQSVFLLFHLVEWLPYGASTRRFVARSV